MISRQIPSLISAILEPAKRSCEALKSWQT
jgi:hypothetical protein